MSTIASDIGHRIFSIGDNRCSVDGCDATYYGNTFCKKHHQWHWKRGLLPKPVVLTPEQIIKRFTKVDEKTGCWIWQRARKKEGYGSMSLPGSHRVYVHRVSYEVFVGPIPDGLEICHRCDNPPCCNPEHLFPGTHLENMRDSANKGRAKQHVAQKGVNNPRSILTADQVRLIRGSKKTGKALAAAMGVNPLTVYRCRNGETYTDVA